MKLLALLGAKYDSTYTCLEHIKNGVNGEVYINEIEKVDSSCLDGFENILLASSIYAGAINKTLKAFMIENEEELLNKNIMILICSGRKKDFEKQLTDNFSEKILEKASFKIYAGFQFNFNKMNLFEKFVVTKFEHHDCSVDSIEYDHLNKFIVELNSIG